MFRFCSCASLVEDKHSPWLDSLELEKWLRPCVKESLDQVSLEVVSLLHSQSHSNFSAHSVH